MKGGSWTRNDSPFAFSPLSAPSCRSAFLPVALDKESAFIATPTTFESCGEAFGVSETAGEELLTTDTDLLMLVLGEWFGTTQDDWLCPPRNMNSSSGRSILRLTGSLMAWRTFALRTVRKNFVKNCAFTTWTLKTKNATKT